MLGGASILPQETAFVSTLLKPIISSALFEFVPNRNRAEQELFKKTWIYFIGRNQKKGKKALLHNCTTARPALFVSLKRSWLGTKVHKWGTWDTGKSEPAAACGVCLPCRAAPADKGTFCSASSALCSASSALSTQNVHTAREEGSPTLCKDSGISSLSWGTQRLHSSLLGSSTAVPRALPCSGAAELLCTNHLLGWSSTQGQLAFSWGLRSWLKHLHLEFLQFLWQAKLKWWCGIFRLNIKDHPEVNPTSAEWNTAENWGFSADFSPCYSSAPHCSICVIYKCVPFGSWNLSALQ